MTRRDHDEWRLPALERFGAQFHTRQEPERTRARAPRRRRFPVGVLVAVLAGAVVVLELVTPAGAQSPVNEAPARARQSATVAFESTVSVALNSRIYTTVREQGVVDFRDGGSRVSMFVPGSGEQADTLTIGPDLYVTQGKRRQWFRLRGASSAGSRSRAKTQTLLDPQVVFTVLEHVRGPVVKVGVNGRGADRLTHYRVATSLQSFLDAEYRGRAEPKVAADTLAVLDVWLDREGRPVSVSARSTGSSRLGVGVVTFHVGFRHYGKPLHILPPAGFAEGHIGHPTAPYRDPISLFESILFSPRRTPEAR